MNTDNHDNSRDGSDPTAELLSQVLHQEAAKVSTDPSALQEIQGRTRPSGSSRRSWVYAGVGAAAATAAVIAGVAILGDGGSSNSTLPADSPQPPTANQEQPPTAIEREPVSLMMTVTYLGAPSNGWRLVTEWRSAEPVPGENPAISNVRAFLTSEPRDPDYSSGWPDGIEAGGIARSNGSIQVDLTGPAGALDRVDPSYPPKARAMALQALFRSADGRVGDTATLTYNGNPVQSAFGVDFPVTVAADDQTRALIQIEDIVDGRPLDNPVTIRVSGNTFEATINWELLDESGATIDDGFVNGGTLNEWASANIDLGTLGPGTYTIECFENSAEDGNIINVDDKTFTVD